MTTRQFLDQLLLDCKEIYPHDVSLRYIIDEDPEMIETSKAIAASHSVREVCINTPSITKAGFLRILDAIVVGECPELSISAIHGECVIDEDLARAIAKTIPGLKRFGFTSTPMGPTEGAIVWAAVGRSHLKELTVWRNGMTDSDLFAILPAVPTMIDLTLAYENITDAGIVALANCISPGMKRLQIKITELSDVSLLAFAAVLPSCRNIHSFDVCGERSTETGYVAIARAVEKTRKLNFFSFDLTLDDLHRSFLRILNGAIPRIAINSKLFALVSALSLCPSSRLAAFLRRDGDTALFHRVAEFLIE